MAIGKFNRYFPIAICHFSITIDIKLISES
jgi:hypothetical protein